MCVQKAIQLILVVFSIAPCTELNQLSVDKNIRFHCRQTYIVVLCSGVLTFKINWIWSVTTTGMPLAFALCLAIGKETHETHLVMCNSIQSSKGLFSKTHCLWNVITKLFLGCLSEVFDSCFVWSHI